MIVTHIEKHKEKTYPRIMKSIESNNIYIVTLTQGQLHSICIAGISKGNHYDAPTSELMQDVENPVTLENE